MAVMVATLLALTQPADALIATGGTVTDTNGYRIHTFTSSGILSVTAGGNVEVLVVAGGGGGGQTIGGGGGAGGFVTNAAYLVVAGSNYLVTVGAGGAGAPASGAYLTDGGAKGSDSVFGSLTAYGGGGGGSYDQNGNGASAGGSGGGMGSARSGGPMAGTQGNAGGTTAANGNYGAGGGGAGTVGANASTGPAGAGGAGLSSDISGASVFYAGGGGGGVRDAGVPGGGGSGGGGTGSRTNGANAIDNTGGGGGGGGYQTSSGLYAGGNGGSGIVIARYPFGGPDVANSNAVVSASVVTLNGGLVDTGMDANVSAAVYWGTNDAGANKAGWTYTNRFPGYAVVGPLSTNVTPGGAGTRYYYRFFASNSFGSAWASPAGSFSTTGAPSINNAGGATNVGPASATLQGEVTGGNPAPYVWIYYGTVNRGTNKDLWEHTNAAGVVSNWNFAATVGGLTPGTTNYYSCYASNIHGEAWATVTNFICLGGVLRTWDGGGADNNASTPANWSPDAAPGPGDDIILNTTSHKNMTWNMTNMTVGSWTQVGYTGTVMIATVYGTAGFTNFNIIGDCVISNGVWTHAGPQATEQNRLSATIGGNLVVGSNGAVNVTGKGHAVSTGPGAGWNTVGASHGGCGDPYNGSSIPPCYGSIVAPRNLGSGSLANGGGAIILNVSGAIRNDGLLCADGAGTGGNGTGAGGSIFVTAGALSGFGAIRANGGSWYNVAPGGGGRIALAVTNTGADFSLYTGSIVAGRGGNKAGAGTVYLRTASQGLYEGTLIIENATVGATEIGPNVTDAAVGDVFIRSGGYLLLRSNQSLRVGGVWSNGAAFASELGSMVIFAGGASSTSTVYGSNTFMGLVCTNATGKTILFEAGRTSTVPAQGRLTLKGSAAATNLILRSTIDGTPWKLNVNALADQSVICVDVKNSDALVGVGAPVIALNSMDQGGNANWVFNTAITGETNTWTGNSNTVWSSSANWSLARPPVDDDFISIPSARPRYPVLDNHRTVNGIDIQPGALLSLNNYNLTIKKTATVAGAITASSTEFITFQTNADFTGGAFTAARSTVLLAGSGNQSVNLATQTFYKVTVLNSAGTNAFTDSFTATELRCEAPGGTRNLQFQQGATVTLRDFIMLGSAASTNIFLRSSSFGQPWNLAVSGYRSVHGVDVRDSDAHPGLPISAISSKDSLNNFNWLFNSTQSVWLGTSGTDFNNAANWSPSGVPGAATRVLVNSANPMIIAGAVTVLDLTVGGGAGQASVTANAALTVIENILVLTNGTLSLNRPCVVSNGLYVLGGGTLSHSANGAADVNKLDVTVYGNAGVDVNGVINVTGKGYPASNGPGAPTAASGINCGGSYGGCGYPYNLPSYRSGPTYGSIVAPTNLGSGGNTTAGGGAILLAVAGAVRNDGVLCADGTGGGVFNGTGSGGSIFVTAGIVSGIGTIQANGGSWYNVGPGGGGRIALVVTREGADFSLYSGSVVAFGAGGGAGAGTIYNQRAADRPGCGTVLLNNYGGGYTDVPPNPPYITNEVNFVSFFITNAATLRLTNNFIIGDLYLQSANAWLDLGSNTLTIRSREHKIGPGSATNVINRGTIIWWPDVPKGVIYSTW